MKMSGELFWVSWRKFGSLTEDEKMKIESLLASACSSASPLSNKLCPFLHSWQTTPLGGSKGRGMGSPLRKRPGFTQEAGEGSRWHTEGMKTATGKAGEPRPGLRALAQQCQRLSRGWQGQWGHLDISVGYQMTSVHSLLVDVGGIIRVLPEHRGGSREMWVTAEDMYIYRSRCRLRATYSWDRYKYIIHVCYHG